MNLFRWVIADRIYYLKKTAILAGISGLLLFISLASVVLMQHIRELADKPLRSLNTELIIQKAASEKNEEVVKTGGLIQPFGLSTFPINQVTELMNQTPEVRAFASALILWKLDTRGTLVIAGLKKSDPEIGLRTVQSMLTEGTFFSADDAEEVIIEKHYARFYGHKLNQPFELSGKRYRITGIVDFVAQSNLNAASLYLPWDTAAALSNIDPTLANQVFVSLDSAADIEHLKDRAEQMLPGYQLITKDNLYKNLKGLNRMLYRFGSTITISLLLVSGILVFWLLKIHRIDFKTHYEILKLIGWGKNLRRKWILYDSAFILFFAVSLSLLLVAIFSVAVLPFINLTASISPETIL